MNNLVLGYIFTLLACTILNVSSMEVVNICAYSADPKEYKPSCYDCPTEVYKNTLSACLSMDYLPKNISFTAANCMEQNCMIPYPQPTPGLEKDMSSFWDTFGKLMFSQYGMFSSRSQRSISDNSVYNPSVPKIQVVEHLQTFVTSFPSKEEVEFGDPEYKYEGDE